MGGVTWGVRTDPHYAAGNLLEEPKLCVEVQNCGFREVTINLAGFLKKGTTHRYVISPEIRDGGTWPRRLQPNDSVTLYTTATPKLLWEDFGEPKCAFVQTASDIVFVGRSAVLTELQQSLRYLRR